MGDRHQFTEGGLFLLPPGNDCSYLQWGSKYAISGGFHHNPLLSTQNYCEKPKMFFALQIVNIEIGKVTKFGDVWRPFWGSWG